MTNIHIPVKASWFTALWNIDYQHGVLSAYESATGKPATVPVWKLWLRANTLGQFGLLSTWTDSRQDHSNRPGFAGPKICENSAMHLKF